MLISAQLDIPLESYACFTILGQFYLLKMAILDHRKELSYIDFKDLFGNGMTRGPKWEHVESLVMTLVYISIALTNYYFCLLQLSVGRPKVTW